MAQCPAVRGLAAMSAGAGLEALRVAAAVAPEDA